MKDNAMATNFDNKSLVALKVSTMTFQFLVNCFYAISLYNLAILIFKKKKTLKFNICYITSTGYFTEKPIKVGLIRTLIFSFNLIVKYYFSLLKNIKQQRKKSSSTAVGLFHDTL